MKIKIVGWCNSLAIRIPRSAAEKADLKEGDSLEIEAAEGQIRLQRISQVPTLSKLIGQITLENRYIEISTTSEMANEKIEW